MFSLLSNINLSEVSKRISYAKVRWDMQQDDQAWGALLHGLPPTVKRPERTRKAPTGKILQVEKKYKKAPTFRQALDRYGDVVRKEAKAAGIPIHLGLAFGWVESTFDPTAYRYEPNWDRWYIHEKPNGLDVESTKYEKYYLKKITIGEWFEQNPKRVKRERRGSKKYNYFAQLRIASSYGLIQVMYPSAVGEGLREKPESMYTPEVGLEIGFSHLNRKRRRKGYTLTDAIAAYNAGSARKKDGKYENQRYVDKIESARQAFKKII